MARRTLLAVLSAAIFLTAAGTALAAWSGSVKITPPTGVAQEWMNASDVCVTDSGCSYVLYLNSTATGQGLYLRKYTSGGKVSANWTVQAPATGWYIGDADIENYGANKYIVYTKYRSIWNQETGISTYKTYVYRKKLAGATLSSAPNIVRYTTKEVNQVGIALDGLGTPYYLWTESTDSHDWAHAYNDVSKIFMWKQGASTTSIVNVSGNTAKKTYEFAVANGPSGDDYVVWQLTGYSQPTTSYTYSTTAIQGKRLKNGVLGKLQTFDNETYGVQGNTVFSPTAVVSASRFIVSWCKSTYINSYNSDALWNAAGRNANPPVFSTLPKALTGNTQSAKSVSMAMRGAVPVVIYNTAPVGVSGALCTKNFSNTAGTWGAQQTAVASAETSHGVAFDADATRAWAFYMTWQPSLQICGYYN